MNTFKRLLTAAAAVAFALSLCACAGGAKGQFQGWAAHDASELHTIAGNSIERAQTLKDNTGATEDVEVDLDKIVADAFSNANTLYREGDYEGAVEAYDGVLVAYPLHYGANVNMVLARLQADQPEEALSQAFVCVYLFPDDAGCLLNAQVAGVACGYDVEDIEEALDTVLATADSKITRELLASSGASTEMMAYYDYNFDWGAIETRLYESLHAKGNSSVRTPKDVCSVLLADLETQRSRLAGDPDVEALIAYVEAVCDQLDIEVDS